MVTLLWGGSWEGFVIENLIASTPRYTEPFFYRTSAGAEIDLLLRLPEGKLIAIEIKRSLNPKPEKGFYFACEDLNPDSKFVVYPGSDRFQLDHDAEAISLTDLAREIA